MLSIRAARLAVLCLALATAAAPASAQAATDLVAAYGFEDTSPASAGDSSVFGNTGSVRGAVRVPGRHGTGMSFDGIDDAITIPDAGALNLASGMTLEAWVNPAVTSGWRTVLLKERRSNVSYGLYASGSAIATNGVDGHAQLSDLDLNEWTHVAATYDGTTLRSYANGVQVDASTARSGPITPGDGPLSIGGNSIWGEWFKGVIDDVRVYDRALSAAEIQADLAAAVGPPAAAPSGPGPAEIGSWSAPESWPMVAVHASMLSTGKVVAWDAFSAAPQSEHVWDPVTGQFERTPSGINLFCAGHVLLPTGELFVAGGHELAYAGLKDTRLFSSTLRSWTAGPDMARGRWYPTTTTLPDGRVLIVSGDGIRPGPDDPFFVRPSDTIPEIYDPKTNTMSAMPSAGRLMPLYPFMFVAPDGRVADVGPDTTTRLLDTGTGQWATLASRAPITGGSAVMYRPGKVLKTGTWTDTDYGTTAIHNRSAVLDLDQTVPAWREVAPMKWGRTYQTLTVLPDGNVLALGGQSVHGANSLANSPVLQPEIWNPETDSWKPMASSVRPRGYHNTSLLLPDGRILLAGSGRLDGSFMVDETSAEIFSPPYLSKGPRPTIAYAPQTMRYGGKIEVQTPDAARIAKVSLVRLGAVTHNINMDQRWQQLSFRQVAGGLEIDAPTSANIAPPGVYYVFLLDDKGVPSKAAILSIPPADGPPPDPDPDPDTTAPSVSVTAPAEGTTVRGQVSVTASATDNLGVSQVQLQLDGQPLGAPDTSAPYTVSWDTATASAGSHALTAVARDAAGNQATSAPVSVIVDNSAPPGPVPVAAYGFEDGVGGSVIDVTGRGHTGTIREATWTAAGKYGNALSFDGVNDWVTVADAPDLDLSSAMTLEAWVYPTRNTAWRTAILKENGSDLAWALYSSGSARPSAWAATSAGMGSTTGPTAPALNTWTHMAATYDGANLRLFINAAQVASAPRTGPLAAGSGPLRLGGNSLWSEWFAGRLDDIRIYDQALTQTQIQTDMNTPAGPAAPPQPAVLSASPASLSFSGTQGSTSPAAKTISVSNPGGGTLSWTASESSAWLSISPGSGTNAGNVTVTPSTAGLAAGTYTTDVTISATGVAGSPKTIAVTLTVEPPAPALSVTPSSLSFSGTAGGADPAAKTLTVANSGGGTMSWSGSETSAWLSLSTAGDTVTVTPAISGLGAGSYTAEVTVTAPGAAGSPRTIPVTLTLDAPPALSTEPASLSFSATEGGSSPVAKTISVTNGGGGTLSWAASEDAGWLSLSPGSGTNDGTITASPSITGLAAGTYTTDVTVSATGASGSPKTIPVTLTVDPPPPPALAVSPATISFTATQGAASPGAKSVSVSNAGSGTLDVTASSNASWLAVSPAGATAPATLTLTPSTGALAAGTYTATVIVTAVTEGATGSARTVDVTLTVNPAMAPGLVGAWGFDEATGTGVTDSSGTGQTGTISGATRTTTGRFGGALSFDGVNDWVTIPDSNPLDLTTGMTIEAWVRPSAVGSDWRTVLLKEQPGNLLYSLYAGEGVGRPATHVFTSADRGTSATTATPLNTWTHLAATYDRTNLRLYVNGTQAATRALTGNLRTSTGALRIGGNNVWAEWFSGLIDEVRVYNRALTAIEIQADMTTAVAGA